MAASPPSTFGYDELAKVFSRFPELFIVRSFEDLRARRILHLQGKLVNHEDEIDYLSARNRRSTDPKVQNFHRSVRDLRGPHDSKEARERWEKEEQIWADLTAFAQALRDEEYFRSLSSPSHYPLSSLHRLLDDEKAGNFFLRGREGATWSAHDLVAIYNPDENSDWFSRWTCRTFLPFWHKILGYRLHEPIALAEGGAVLHYYSPKSVAAVTHCICTIVIPVLPNIPIFTLDYINDRVARQGTILALTFLFTLVISIFTKPTSVDIYAAALAVTAIQVVYVGTASTR